jgi:hypothetical protein
MPRRAVSIAAAAALALATCGAAAASPALGDAFNQLVSPQTAQTTPTTPTPTATTPATGSTSSSTSGGGLSTGVEFAIFAAALALIGGIAFVIMRDARRAAPVKAHDSVLAGGRPNPGRAERLRRQRERAKQARRSRKRNR